MELYRLFQTKTNWLNHVSDNFILDIGHVLYLCPDNL